MLSDESIFYPNSLVSSLVFSATGLYNYDMMFPVTSNALETFPLTSWYFDLVSGLTSTYSPGSIFELIYSPPLFIPDAIAVPRN